MQLYHLLAFSLVSSCLLWNISVLRLVDIISEDGRWKSAVNMINKLGTGGHLPQAFATLLHQMWQGQDAYLTPYEFRVRF
jgi:hypothetical protein